MELTNTQINITKIALERYAKELKDNLNSGVFNDAQWAIDDMKESKKEIEIIIAKLEDEI